MAFSGQLIALAGVALATLVVSLALRRILTRRQFSLSSLFGFVSALAVGLALVSYGRSLERKGNILLDEWRDSVNRSN